MAILSSYLFYGSIIVGCGGCFVVDLAYFVVTEERSKTKKSVLRRYMKEIAKIIKDNESI